MFHKKNTKFVAQSYIENPRMKRVIVFASLIISSLAFGQVSILEENFDGTEIPSSWKVINQDGFTVANDVQEYTEAWIIKEDPFDATNGTASSTSYFSPSNRASRWLVTPQITLGAESNYISWQGMSFDPSFPDSYKVLVSTSGNDIADFTDTLVLVINETPEWNKHTELLDDYAGQSIYLAFVNNTYDGFKLFLDSIYIREQDPLAVSKHALDAQVYPNPFMNQLSIHTGNALMQTVSIVNMLGEVVYQQETTGFQVTIPSENFKRGIYFLSIQTTQGEIRKKVIKN